MSAQLLETASRWRAVPAIAILSVVVLPTLTMLLAALAGESEEVLRPSFMNALINAIVVAVAVTLMAVLIGLPMGVLAGRYMFPLREAALALVALPLLLPTFLWAIGWSAVLDLPAFAGTILSFAAPSVSLVALTAFVAAHSLSASQVEAALLAGGEFVVLKRVAGYVLIPAIGAALLAGLLTLSDPGPGQIFGLSTAAGEILTSFSAFYDFNLASRQCLALAGVVLTTALPLGVLMGPKISSEVLARQTRPPRLSRNRSGGVLALAVVLLFSIGLWALPILGLIGPVVVDPLWGRVWEEFTRTAESTVLYAIGSGSVATLLGVVFAAAVGRNERLKGVAIAFCFVLFAVSPAVTALAFVQAGTASPEWAEPVFRSRFAVMLASGVRFFPVAALIALRSWSSMPRTWALAGAIHGVPLRKYARSVVVPFLAPSLAVSVAVCGLLATADVVTVLLVHPPGQSSLPLTIFSIMANARQSLVAGLCLIYVASSLALLSVLFLIGRRKSR